MSGSRPGGELRGKVALVTGGTAGIGRAICTLLAAHGASVVVVGRSSTAAEEVLADVQAAGGDGEFISAQLGDPAAVQSLVPQTVERFGRVDILVNNAATPSTSSFLGTSLDEWYTLQQVNATAPFLLMQAAGTQMIDQGDGGRIVNVTSSSAFRAVLAPPAYASSKAALTSLTRSAAAELGPHGINVNAVAPGPTGTRMILGRFETMDAFEAAAGEGPLANLLHRPTWPDDAANVAVFLCLPASRQITAQTLHVSAGAIV